MACCVCGQHAHAVHAVLAQTAQCCACATASPRAIGGADKYHWLLRTVCCVACPIQSHLTRCVELSTRNDFFFLVFFLFFYLVLSVGGADNTVALFDRSSGQTVHKMKGHTKKVLLLRERDSDSTVERI
jgi:hypothetical protein